MPKKKWKSEQDKQKFMASQTGQEWLAKKIAERKQRQGKQTPPPERLTRTKYPFRATINGRTCTVTKEAITYD